MNDSDDDRFFCVLSCLFIVLYSISILISSTEGHNNKCIAKKDKKKLCIHSCERSAQGKPITINEQKYVIYMCLC